LAVECHFRNDLNFVGLGIVKLCSLQVTLIACVKWAETSVHGATTLPPMNFYGYVEHMRLYSVACLLLRAVSSRVRVRVELDVVSVWSVLCTHIYATFRRHCVRRRLSAVAEHLLAQHNAVKMLHGRIRIILDYIKAVESGNYGSCRYYYYYYYYNYLIRGKGLSGSKVTE